MDNLKRIVIKLGTQVVTDEADFGPATERVRNLIDESAQLHESGRQIILVSSGAIGLGRKALKLQGQLSLAQKQACAAVGQNLLMNLYREMFSTHKITTAQVLLTSHDFSDRAHYLSMKRTFEELLKLRVLPIVNENDTVSAAEIVEDSQSKSFGDNDKLSALVAAKLDANLLLILTNVEGVYDENPRDNSNARLIERIENLEELRAVNTQGLSSLGRGGMLTKLEAARIAGICGVRTIISSGFVPSAITSALDRKRGTEILAQTPLSGKKRWIALSSGFAGIVSVNACTLPALIQGNASLLPVGITKVEGDFSPGDVISIHDTAGQEIGRGISSVSSEILNQIKGKKSSEIQTLLPNESLAEAIHRDNLVIFRDTLEV